MNATTYEPADIRIYTRDRGLVLTEKSLIALHTSEKGTPKIAAIGNEAAQIAEQNQSNAIENIQIISPLRQGKIADHTLAVRLFSFLLQKAWGKKPLRRRPVALCIPQVMTAVEKRALQDTLYMAGAKELLISGLPYDRFIKEMPEPLPKQLKKFSTIIEITKNDPEPYIREQLAELLCYAGQEGISRTRIAELLHGLSS